VEEACAFFEGKSKELIAGLESEMQAAAARFDFEKAAELRDMLAGLRQTAKPSRTFERGARMRALSSIDPLADVRELQEALHLERPPLVMECFDIANIGTAHCVASMVRFADGVPDTANYRRYRIKIVSGQNDFAAMAEVIRRRYSRILLEGRQLLGEGEADFSQENPLEAMRRMERGAEGGGRRTGSKEGKEDRRKRGGDRGEKIDEPREASQSSILSPLSSPPSPLSSPPSALRSPPFVRLPDLVIVDGGKGQLSSAMNELQRLGLHELPIIGLAKENEEIYRPGYPQPLQLPHEMGALKLLQRIRDEAHRWANSYHQLLLARRVQESLLDDCPGVSEPRKQALLRRFGSVARLRKASAEQIAQTPGIGKALAAEITAFLSKR
jgi:excinuclease ABC subunit C